MEMMMHVFAYFIYSETERKKREREKEKILVGQNAKIEGKNEFM